MTRRTQTYAIRLAVEGGGQVKAELVSVGQSGEQSLKRIETAGDRASGGLKGLGRQAELLRTGIRTLGGALIGAATVGGLGALIDRSISAADAIGKTADKIGVGVEALQELRLAAKASGVEQQTLDMALQRFTRRAAEAAQGTGEAKDALAQMGIALGDQSGNLRRSERTCSPTSRMPSLASRIRPSASGSPSSCSIPRAWRWSTCSATAAGPWRTCASGPVISASSWTSTWCAMRSGRGPSWTRSLR
jgi:hypothetical protein